jgi:glucose uptake protein
MGSFGMEGRSFITDLRQADFASVGYAVMGGVIFNLSNLLIVAAITIAGLSVAFPIAVGLALVLGVLINYLKVPTGTPLLLFAGVMLGVIAIVINALASRKAESSKGKTSTKGIIISVISGIIMSFFLPFCGRRNDDGLYSSRTGKTDPIFCCPCFFFGTIPVELCLEHIFYV